MKSTLPKAVVNLTHELGRLPGIGPKTAQRLAIHLLRQPERALITLVKTLSNLHASVKICTQCFNLAENDLCSICRDEMRDESLLCVVEDPLDVDAIERTGSYNGRYHVLGGVLSPIEGVLPDQLTISELVRRVQGSNIRELIIALDHSMEAEATSRLITSELKNIPIPITRLARGLPTGGDIEFADALTLSAALEGRKKL